MEKYLCGTEPPIGDLHTETIIDQLTDKEHKYSAYLSLATWAGLPILLSQISTEAPLIHQFLFDYFINIDEKILANAKNGGNPTPLHFLIEYAATFYQNSGNYLGLGDKKFIPRVSKEKLRELVSNPRQKELLDKCIDQMYDVSSPYQTQLGFYPNGLTAYYEPNDFTQSEVDDIDAILMKNHIYVQNTKIIRHSDKYEVSVASVEVDSEGKMIGKCRDLPVLITKGRCSQALQKVCMYLEKSIPYAANQNQEKMLRHLINSYITGSIEEHIQYSKEWVNDIDPKIEIYHGFIEYYRDPAGVRGEFEGFVAAVDLKESEILKKYVDSSPMIMKLLPYPREYERATFRPPSYNSIKLLTMCATMYPSGINIPNYEEIRQHYGFKNVSISNTMFATPVSNSILRFIPIEMRETFKRLYGSVRLAGVASHELYGHGCGRLLYKDDVLSGKIPNALVPGALISTFYPDGVTFDRAFGALGQNFEECRAEATNLYLTMKDEVMEIFGIPNEDREMFRLVSAYNMLVMGLSQLTYYNAESSQWKQAHASGRFAILRACLMWGRGSVKINVSDDNITIVIDPTLMNEFQDAVKKMLIHLNYFKTTYQPDSGREFFGALTSVDSFMLNIKNKCDSQSTPKPLFVGAYVERLNDEVHLVPGSKGNATIVDSLMSFVKNIKAAQE